MQILEPSTGHWSPAGVRKVSVCGERDSSTWNIGVLAVEGRGMCQQ